MKHISVLDWSGPRREAIVAAIGAPLDEADVLDPATLHGPLLLSIPRDGIALIGLSVYDDVEFAVVRHVLERGCEVLAYAHDWDRASLAVRCRALIAGATNVIDTCRADFIHEIRTRLNQAIERDEQRREEVRRVTAAMARFGMIGESVVMLSIGRWILKVSPLSDLPVLIGGETGTGKELIARAIHGLDPKRSRGPFVPLNCAALAASLAESELFGHRKGAFTGASQDRRGLIRAAEGGTLFLDEIGDLEPGLQGKLLRVLQENRVRGVGEDREDRVNVRVIAATHQELPALVEQGRFREDLFHRLNLLTARAPSLAERGADIDVLVRHFIVKHGGPTLSPLPSLLAALKAMPMPGNVRQLENLIRHAVVNARTDGTLGVEELPPSVWDQLSRVDAPDGKDAAPQDWAAVLDSNSWSLSRSLLTCERHFLKAALTRSQGNQSATARLLGITPRSIYNKIRKHRLAG
jgi:transcriptional regulator with GAF, ATPase, and Fis domain